MRLSSLNIDVATIPTLLVFHALAVYAVFLQPRACSS